MADNVKVKQIEKEIRKQIDLDILFKSLIGATHFDSGKIMFEPLGPVYRRLWNEYKAMDIASENNIGDWRKVPTHCIVKPPFVPEWDNVFALRNKLVMHNVAGFNDDIRSRAEEYSNLFDINEDEIREYRRDDDFFGDHPDLEYPEWYEKWSDTSEYDSKSNYITYRDLAYALSNIKSGKQDDNYELFINAKISFPNSQTVRIDVDFDHGS